MFAKSILAASALVATALAQSSTTTPAATMVNTDSATILIGTATANSGVAISIVNADACGETTYQAACTNSLVCGAFTGTVTQGPTLYQISYMTQTSTLGADIDLTVSESCSLSGSSYAACSASLGLSANGQETSTSTSSTLSGEQVVYGTFPITAGAEKLPTAACTATTENGARATGVGGVVKVLVVPAAAVVAGAAML